MLMKIWCYGWAYIYEVLGLLDRAGKWILKQVDHNDYMVGGLVVLDLVLAAKVAGWM